MPTTSQPQTRIAIDQAILEKIDQIRPQYMDRTTFINFQLDSVITLNSPSAQARGPWGGGDSKEEDDRAREELVNKPPTSYKKPKDPWAAKRVNPALVPEDLTDVAENFVEWWSVRNKGAVRSESVAHREFAKLRAWDKKDRAKALQKAIASGWKQLYEPKDLRPTQGQYSASEAPHPASKVFKASDLGPEWERNAPPSMTDGKGVLEGMF